jgi:RHS repeat-associated protein
VSFRPLPGTLGRLEALGENNISILDAQPGPVTLRLDSTGDIYNPTLFRYTTPDGTMIDLDTLDGIKRAETPGGQVLTITPTSIMHSNGTVVDIERDEAGRITQITDPGGFTQDYRYDANGNLRSHSDQEEFVTRFRYDAKHNVIEIIDPLNRPALRNDYDESGRLVRAINADGDSVSYVHDVAGRQEQITDADGFVTVVEFDDYGNAIKITDPLGGVTSNVYDADGNLTATTNAVGETTLLSYDTRGNLVTQTNAIGATVEFVYDGGDRLILERDALGRETSFEYDASGRLASITGAAGIIARRINYDANGNVLSARDANGRTTSYAYNDAGFRTEIVDPRGNSTQFTVNANGRLRSLTDPRGGVSTATLDRRGLLVSAEAPLGNEMSLVFNGARDFIGMSDSDARSLARTVSIGGRVTRFEDPSGNTTQMQFDGRGHRIQLTDASGRVSRFDFDALGRQIRVHYPSGAVAAASYDLVGRIVTETDPNGNVTSYEYDSAGRNTAVTDALGQRTEFTYDLVGNLTARLDARGNMTRYIYDVLDRLIETEYADGSTETIDYDPVGNVIAEIDRLGRTKSYTYDPNDNLLSVTDIDGGVTTYAYDANDNRTSQTDPNGHTTRMVYDANDRLIEKQYPDGSAERYEYDAGNRVARTILPDGKYIDATYDGFGRPTGYDLNGEATESFTYDGAGRPVSSTNLWGTVDYSYDLDGRVAEIRSEGGHRVTYTYDDLGNRTSISTQLAGQAARTTTYTYDALNRLATIVEPDGDTTTYSYDPVGNVASITYPNGVISSFTYDDVNQLTRIEHRQGATTLAAYDYTLDAGGRRLRVDHVSGDSVSFSYDSADRLLQETHRNASGVVIFEQTFTYDDVGNRLTQQITGQARTVLAYDSADKLLIAGSTTFAYDANGRLISKTAPLGTVSYVYDVEGQLLRVTTSTGTVTYAYDAMGKRRVRIGNGSEQNFLLDEASLTGFDQTLVAFDDSDNQLVEYHWGDRLISADDGRSDRFFHADASSNIRLLTDELGTASDTIDYDAFGNVRDRTGPADSPYGFAGEWQEEAEGLVFLRARFYDPETGRFISRDPFAGNPGDPVSLHRYLYANANPVMNTDPSGQLTLVEVNIAGAISAGIAAIYYGITANGASFWELAPKVAIAYVFGAAGAVLGAGAAVAVEAGAALAFARVVVGEAVRKWSLVIANALAQGLVAAIAGVQQLKLTLRYEKGASYTDEMGTREAMKLFAITFVMEFITMGHYNPSLGAYKDVKKPTYKPASAAEKTAEATRAVSAGTRSGDKKLFELWQASGEDIIPFITRVAKEGEKGPARSAARSLTSRLNKMGGEAEDILKNVFSGKVELGRRLAPRIFRTEAQAASFIDSVKLIASPIVDEALK